MRRAVAPLLCCLVLISCATKPDVKSDVEVEVAEPLSPKASILKLTRDFYDAVQNREAELLADLITPDAMSFGVGPADSFVFRDNLVVRVRQDVGLVGAAGDALKIESGPLLVGVSTSQQSGWVYDAPVLVLTKASGSGRQWAGRLTGHAVLEEGRWRFDALHVSMAVEDVDLNAADALKRFAAPPEFAEEKGAGAEPLIDVTKRINEDVVVKLQRLSNRDEVALIGTGPKEIYLGGRAFKDLVRPNLAELKKAVFTLKPEGPIRARVAPGGGSGWVAANVILKAQVGRKMVQYPTFRMLWVLEKEGETWNVVQEHQSVGLKPDQRASTVPTPTLSPAIDGGMAPQK